MSNRLARAAQGLSLSEKRIICAGLANTDSKSASNLAEATTDLGWKLTVHSLDYANTFNVEPQTAYEQLKAAADRLFERHVRYEDTNERGKPRINKFRWISAARYVQGEGYIELNFTKEIAPHLLGLRQHFTSYRLQHASAFESIYAWRLFEVLQSWQSTGFYSTSIEDFWEAMEAPPSCRKDFKALRVRVIEPAVEAIRSKCGWLVEWTPLRAGARRITSLEFRFGPDPQGKLPLDEVSDTE
ncbi:replication initiation protein [mine drainage metagenome]|uniref:Replication initiation protein n=1 Tax=mine drainage metagenome TaxID=410659 RepID=A0A1J5Q5M8_9ZZZZ